MAVSLLGTNTWQRGSSLVIPVRTPYFELSRAAPERVGETCPKHATNGGSAEYPKRGAWVKQRERGAGTRIDDTIANGDANQRAQDEVESTLPRAWARGSGRLRCAVHCYSFAVEAPPQQPRDS